MGYEDIRVIGQIRDSDRCCLCGLLCSIDLFIETKCYHLFCAECFQEYLKRNGHTGEIRDENNYLNLYNPVRCPVSSKILGHKHTKGAVCLKVKQYYSLSRYKIQCEFFPVGCHTTVKASRLSKHYQECFFTSRRFGYDRSIGNYNLFQPIDYCENNLYGEMKLRTEMIKSVKKDGNLKRHTEQYASERRCSSNDSDSISKFKSLELNSFIDSKDYAHGQLEDYLDLKNQKNELRRTESLDFTKDDFESQKLGNKSNRFSLSNCLLSEHTKLKESALMLMLDNDPKKYRKLTRQLDVLEKNINFIKQELLRSNYFRN